MVNDHQLRLDNEDLEEVLVAYSLGALPPEEAAAFEAQLDAPEIQAAHAAYRETVETLNLAPALRTPPPTLKARLMARLDEAAAPPAARPRHRLLVLRRLSPWLAAAAMLLVSFGLGLRVWQQQAQLAEMQAVLTKPQMVAMEAGEVAPKAQGRFYLAPDSTRAVLIVADLPPLSQDKAYQLWLVGKDDVRDNGGTFRVDSHGYGTYLVAAPRPLREYKRIGVTTEPAGGSPGPTSGRVIGASLDAPQPVEW
ncbi:MAG: anti-sigma factor [Anaerolineae bacterium]|nr:anti-sigma factor [Anaerolineae bacterium]